MKKIIVSLCLFAATRMAAQNASEIDTSVQRAITPVGLPIGRVVELKIDKDGGKFISDDGRLELIIPAGALSKKTTISIQPIKNMVPNGNGDAYRLEPSGIQFQKPLQLIIHYTDDEAADSMQQLLRIGMQDKTGQWYGLKNTVLDTEEKTLSGMINHFSSWGMFDAIKLYPEYSRIKVKKSVPMEIDLVENEGTGDEVMQLKGDDLEPLSKKRIPWTVSWSADGIQGGNSSVGTIKANGIRFGNYTAPAKLPAKNPVAVSADLKGISYALKNETLKHLTLVSNILVYDNAYEINIVSSSNGMAGTVLGNASYKDSGSLVVDFDGKNAKIIEKVNKNLTDVIDYTGNCTTKVLTKGAGNVHIAGAQSIRVTPGGGPDVPALIDILFIRVPVRLSLIQVSCPNKKGPPTVINSAAANTMMAALAPAFPQQIKFSAKEGEQTLLTLGTPGTGIYVMITAKKIEED